MPLCEGPNGKLAPELKHALQLLISANHILHCHGLVDAFGHISVRHPLKPDCYIIAAYDPGAPALVSSRADFIEYFVLRSEPTDGAQPKGYSERYIHGEIYARFPEVQCVVHSHSEAVIPFTAAKIPVKPIFHMAGFLGADGPPTFDVTALDGHDPSNDAVNNVEPYSTDMLIKTSRLGDYLAQAFCTTQTKLEAKEPEYAVVLQHKHGFSCIGDSIQQAVYRAVYTQKNCKLLKDAIALVGGFEEDVQYLTQEEAEACATMNKLTQDKAFRLWLREVQVHRLYRNEEGIPEALLVGGMNQH